MFASKNIKKKPFEKKNDNNQFKNNYPTKRRNFHKFADSPVINGGFMLPSNQIHSENQVNMVRKYISAPESIIQLKPLKGERTISRPSKLPDPNWPSQGQPAGQQCYRRRFHFQARSIPL